MREADSATVKREQKLTKEKSQGSKANSQSPTHIQMKRILKITLFIAITGIFGWTIWFLYQKSEEKPVLFQTQLPEVTDIVKKTVATGAVVPRKEVNIKPRVSGIIEQLYVIAGDKVKKGDMIARIKIIPNMVNLNEAENRLNRAKLTLDNAKMDYDRNKKLYESRMIAMSEFQSYLLSFNTAKAELETAENNLQLIKEGISKSSGSVSNTIVRSTIEGMVLDVPLKEGSSVIESNTFNEGTTIAVVADLGEMIFEGKVDESEVGKIKPGMDLILTIGAIEAEKFDAELEYIAPKGVKENGAIQFVIKAKMKLKEGTFIRAGYSATADIVLDRKDSVLSLSESLLQFENEDKPYVEVETAPQTFEKRYVKLGLSDGIRIEVLDGVKKTDKIKDPNSNNKTEEIPGGEG
jgi:HlyD family secretion protein